MIILPADTEDEIVGVLCHFRERRCPDLFSRNPTGCNIGNRSEPVAHKGYFSDVRYTTQRIATTRNATKDAGNYVPCIEATYLFDKVLALRFRITMGPIVLATRIDGSEHRCYTNSVTYIDEFRGGSFLAGNFKDRHQQSSVYSASTRANIEALRLRLETICERVNSSTSTSTNASLFAVLSRLLMLLNELQTRVLLLLPSPEPSRSLRRNPPPMALPRLWLASEKISHLAAIHQERGGDASAVDVAILLVRCAAVGRYREVFLNPLPPASPRSFFAVGGGEREWVLVNRIWKATERCYHPSCMKRPKSRRNHPTHHQQQQRLVSETTKQRSAPLPMLRECEQELAGFFHSLPWVRQGKVTVVQKSKRDDGNSHKEGGFVFEVCLDLEDNNKNYDDQKHQQQQDPTTEIIDDDASYSPRFARLCRKHGSLTAYHGTHMDHAWSILNNGFCSMSDDESTGGGRRQRFAKNGAVLGSGVYLSTSRRVATFFATAAANQRNAPRRALAEALYHESLVELLLRAAQAPGGEARASRGILRDAIGAVGEKASLRDRYDVNCYPVFEAKIVRPPEASEVDNLGGKGTLPPSNNDATTIDPGYRPTRRDGTYCVVPDGRDVRITKLHLTVELECKRRGDTWWHHRVLLLLVFRLSSLVSDHPVLLVIAGLVVSVACRNFFTRQETMD
ncbi:unnamed protein product [Pseudo-nitzschia multistriata]|uniref:PARP catalytic domain-containing protein n=1 Tax=Pseudo-nitzschia multistriata TaxID=183589 RepID=A0A448ZHM1_9STRA|nr:unnamed protein product [Pseudo-nitzschia multistriata]